MLGGGFLFETVNEGQPCVIRWVTHNRGSGILVRKTDPLVSFETIAGETFSLIPDTKRPWFRPEDGGGDCLYGKLQNYPGVDANKTFKTDSIARATTNKGEIIETLLALRQEPYKGPVKAITPDEFGAFIGELFRKAVRGEPEGDDEQPTRKDKGQEPPKPSPA